MKIKDSVKDYICCFSTLQRWYVGKILDINEEEVEILFMECKKLLFTCNPVALRTAKPYGVLAILSAVGFNGGAVKIFFGSNCLTLSEQPKVTSEK